MAKTLVQTPMQAHLQLIAEAAAVSAALEMVSNCKLDYVIQARLEVRKGKTPERVREVVSAKTAWAAALEARDRAQKTLRDLQAEHRTRFRHYDEED